MTQQLLCIDDDTEDLEIFEEAMRVVDSSYECIKALTGDKALELLKFITPNYIFLDLNMPVINGIQLLELLRSQRRLDPIPIIIFSTSIGDENYLIEKGATRCITKPSTFSGLCDILKTYFIKGVPLPK